MKARFLKVAVKEEVKTQIDILAAVNRKDISVFVGELVQVSWDAAKQAGKVNDEMLAVPVMGESAAVSAEGVGQ